MSNEIVTAAYVRTEYGTILVQRPADNIHGFELCDDSQSWPGGFGIGGSWDLIPETEVPEPVRERLGFLINDI